MARRTPLKVVWLIPIGAGLVVGLSAQEHSASESERFSPSGGAQETPPAPASPASGEQVRTPSQPSAEEIIKEFEKNRPTNLPVRPRMPSEGTNPEDSAPPATAGTLREGEYVTNALGRLVRDGEWWQFVFESDAAESPRPPMRLLPNMQLERVVRETNAADVSPVFLVSGEVTLFESQNYLLLRKALRRRSLGNLQP